MRHTSLIIILLSLLVVQSTFAAPNQGMTPSQILFQVRRGQIEEAIDLYRNYVEKLGRADHELLQQIGLALLDYGATSTDPETQLMAIFGAGVAVNERATHILARGLDSQQPQIALASLNLLAERQTDSADELIRRAVNSPYIVMRLEAIYLLAKKKHAAAVGQAEALMAKLPPVTWFLFAEIFATLGDTRSIRQLRRLMNNEVGDVRLAAILAAAEHGRDDLLPQIRQLSTHLDTNQQEACAGALGVLKDQGAIDRLKVMAESKSAAVRLASSIALYKLGCEDYGQRVLQMAKEGNTIALFALGDIEGHEDFLAAQIGSPHTNIDLNASLALMLRRDVRCLPGLKRILLGDNRHLAFVKVVSQGKTLSGWKAVSSASVVDTPVALELSTSMRESCLRAAANLPDGAFLSLAEAVLADQQNDLVPAAVNMLENLGNDDAIALLKKYQQKVGAPLVRNSCNLALFRLGVEGPYAEALQAWVEEQADIDLIRFRAMVPRELSEQGSSHLLTPEESSRLFLTSVESLAARQDDRGVNVLLTLIRDGNPKNRYALAGLLIRTIQ